MVDEPARDVAVDTCIKAWQELSTCREIGQIVGPIPWTAVATWCEWHDDVLDRSAARIVMDVIGQLDSALFEREASKRALAAATGAGT